MVGAVGSRLGGGSYEDGAVLAAVGYLFNELGSLAQRGSLWAKQKFSEVTQKINIINLSESEMQSTGIVKGATNVYAHSSVNGASSSGD